MYRKLAKSFSFHMREVLSIGNFRYTFRSCVIYHLYKCKNELSNYNKKFEKNFKKKIFKNFQKMFSKNSKTTISEKISKKFKNFFQKTFLSVLISDNFILLIQPLGASNFNR